MSLLDTARTLVKPSILLSGFLFAGISNAASIESYLISGNNVIEDDSNEYVFRLLGDNYVPIFQGDLMEGDVLVQMFDFPIINVDNIDSVGDELTGLALNVVADISNERQIDPIGPGPYTGVDIDFDPASAFAWLNIVGVDLASFLFDTSDLVALLYYDESNNFDVFTQGLFNGGLATLTDGDLVFALSESEDSDFIEAREAPLDISTFLPGDPGEVPGVTIYGTFGYGLSVVYEDVDGVVDGTFTGSGNNLVTNRPQIAPVIDDTQATFNYEPVPVPATIALFGIGLIGLGLNLSRRGKKS